MRTWERWVIAVWTTLLAIPVFWAFVSYAQVGCLGRADCTSVEGVPGPLVSVGVLLIVLSFQASVLFLVFSQRRNDAPADAQSSVTPKMTRGLAMGWATVLALPTLVFLGALANGRCGELDEGCSTGDLYPFAPKIAAIFAVVSILHVVIAAVVLSKRRIPPALL